jgi:hypothetical protein
MANVYTYQWQRDGLNIGSATSSTYTLVMADDGHNILCVVTATNSVGSTEQASNSVGPVIAILAAGAADTSLSSDSVHAGIHAFRGAADTSLSSDTAAGAKSAHRAVSDTSLSLDVAFGVAHRPYLASDISLSSDSSSAAGASFRILSDVSLSADSAASSLQAFTADISVSSDSTIGQLAGFRAVLHTSLSSDTATVLSHVANATASDISLSWDILPLNLIAPVSDMSLSSDQVVVFIQFTGYQIHVRERAPLRLTVNVTTPGGARARWAVDDPSGENVPGSLNVSTVMPGGHEQGSCVLARDPSYSYPDLVELSRIQVAGAGNQIVHEGRIESYPSTGGDQAQITPTWLGYQDHLTDDASAREIFVDRAIGSWQGPGVQRQLQEMQNPGGAFITSAPSITPDFTTSYPSLTSTMSGSWTEFQLVEGWYDAQGIPLGRVYAAWETSGNFPLAGGTAWGAGVFLMEDDVGWRGGVPYGYDWTPISGSPGIVTLANEGDIGVAPFAMLQFWNYTLPGGKDGVDFSVFWTAIGVYGNHGLPTYWAPGSSPYQDAQGVLASDVIAYAVQKWAPLINYSTGANGTIQPSSFVIPHLIFPNPGTVADMITGATGFELLDWAVWEGPEFYMNAKGARGSKWRTRIGAAALQETGPQIGRLWNGVMVSFTDAAGIARTVGPPGSGAGQTDPSLIDPDPDNPSNRVLDPYGRVLHRWAPLNAGTAATASQAIAVGAEFLAEQKLFSTAGQATITGHVQNENGIWMPAYMMRAGDQLSVVDSSDPSYRRLVHTAYDDPTKANTLQLDQPPDGMQALLERLQVSLVPFGM